jgi:hypothetical protein
MLNETVINLSCTALLNVTSISVNHKKRIRNGKGLQVIRFRTCEGEGQAVSAACWESVGIPYITGFTAFAISTLDKGLDLF